MGLRMKLIAKKELILLFQVTPSRILCDRQFWSYDFLNLFLFFRIFPNKAGYTANTSRGRVGRGGNACFPTFRLVRDGPTNRRTDKASYHQQRRVASSEKRCKQKQLKVVASCAFCFSSHINCKDTIGSGKVRIFARTFSETFFKFLFQNRNLKQKISKTWDLKIKLIYWRLVIADVKSLVRD